MPKIALGRLMGAISKNIEAQFKSRLSDLNIDLDSNYSYLQYLVMVSAYNGVSQNELAKIMNVGKGSVSKAVKYLLQHDLIYRKQAKEDTRIKNVFVTEKGKKTAEKFRLVFLDINIKFVDGFSDREIEVLRSMLERIYKNTAIDENNFIMDDLSFLDQ